MVLLECILIELPNIGGAIAPPAPPVLAPLIYNGTFFYLIPSATASATATVAEVFLPTATASATA